MRRNDMPWRRVVMSRAMCWADAERCFGAMRDALAPSSGGVT